jgi:hypothetical protein
MKDTMRTVGGVRMTEFAMSQAYYEYGVAVDWNRFAVLRQRLNYWQKEAEHGSHDRFGSERSRSWDRCVAVVNGKAVECYRVENYLILVDDTHLVVGPHRLGFVRRAALSVAWRLRRVLRWTN